MTKKILGVMVVATFFMGVPFFAMATWSCNIPLYTNAVDCVAGSGSWVDSAAGSVPTGACTIAGVPVAATDAASCSGTWTSTTVPSYAYFYAVGACQQRSDLFFDPSGSSNCESARVSFKNAHPSYVYDVNHCTPTSQTLSSFNAQFQSSCAGDTAGVLPTSAGDANVLPLSVSTPLANPIKCSTFSGLVALVTKTAVEILMPFVVLAFIWSGFLFVRAQGKDEALTEAKKAIGWSIIGAFILMGAWGFAQIIGTTVTSITGTTPSTNATDNCQ